MKFEEHRKQTYRKLVEKIQHNVKVYKGSCLPPKDSVHFQEIEQDVDELLKLMEIEGGISK